MAVTKKDENNAFTCVFGTPKIGGCGSLPANSYPVEEGVVPVYKFYLQERGS